MPRKDITLPALAVRVAKVLREAGDEGLTLREIETAVGSRWCLRVIRSMCRAGYNIGETADGHLVLVIEPEDKDREAPAASMSPAGASLSSELRLFGAPRIYSEAA
jgi:hypothetical protein